MGTGSWELGNLFHNYNLCVYLINHSAVMMEPAQGISVFLNDATSYDKAMTKFTGGVPAYIYLTTDGSCPKAAPGSGLSGRSAIDSY